MVALTSADRTRSYAGLAVGVIAVSFAAIFIRMTTAPPAVTAMYRMWMTCVVLAPFAVRGLRQAVRKLTPKERWLLLLSGAFLAIHFILWIGSLFYTSVASSTLLLALEPVFALIGGIWLLGERAPHAAWWWALLAVAGTAVIGFHDLRAGGTAPYGDLLSLLGSLAATAYMLAGRRLRGHLNAMHYSFSVFVIAGLLLTGYSLARGYSLVHYPVSDWRAFVLLALIPTVFGHALFNTLLKHLPASMIAMSIVGEPLGATLLAWLIFGDRVPVLWYVGAALVVVGVLAFMRALHLSQSHAEQTELVQMISAQGPVD
jgi:drug/metabolite transporter (DMT)-like permease